MDFVEAYLLTKLGHPELAGWWGKLLGGDGKAWDEMTWDDVIAATIDGSYKLFEEIGSYQPCHIKITIHPLVHIEKMDREQQHEAAKQIEATIRGAL